MELIRVATQRLLKSWADKQQDKRAGIVKSSLKQFLTRQEQRHVAGYFLEDARIILNIDSSAWLYQLNLKKEQLLKYLNQALGSSQAITEILLRLDRDEAKS
jgi:predicted nucleic acid-binding Zn ribbon protein